MTIVDFSDEFTQLMKLLELYEEVSFQKSNRGLR